MTGFYSAYQRYLFVGGKFLFFPNESNVLILESLYSFYCCVFLSLGQVSVILNDFSYFHVFECCFSIDVLEEDDDKTTSLMLLSRCLKGRSGANYQTRYLSVTCSPSLHLLHLTCHFLCLCAPFL
ncbi:hypothetical protein CICLE_v10002849mg [Citrus x clementina]|uniref:Uncharacterized protein n=1 Tax=Citrus clementina TaxID=85681 RepID=V4UZA1_CITCL|nr:hypothetical protein CICLE_v10002849mg [Citrus x clementina]